MEFLRALGHPVRIAIVDTLIEKNEQTVTDIYSALNIPQAVASHHLRIMKDKNIVVSKRKGKQIFYSLKHDAIEDILKALEVIMA